MELWKNQMSVTFKRCARDFCLKNVTERWGYSSLSLMLSALQKIRNILRSIFWWDKNVDMTGFSRIPINCRTETVVVTFNKSILHDFSIVFVSSTTLRTTPLVIEVYPRKAIECELTDNGFSPSLIRMDEGTSVHWRWSGTSVPHTISEVRYNHKTGMLVRKETDTRPLPSKASDCIREFP